MMTHLDNLHLRQGEAASAHGHSTVTWGWLDTAVVICVRLVAGVPNHINFICKQKIINVTYVDYNWFQHYHIAPITHKNNLFKEQDTIFNSKRSGSSFIIGKLYNSRHSYSTFSLCLPCKLLHLGFWYNVMLSMRDLNLALHWNDFLYFKVTFKYLNKFVWMKAGDMSTLLCDCQDIFIRLPRQCVTFYCDTLI